MNSASAFVLLCAAALVVGALIPIQAATNAALSKSIESVFYASLVLFIVGLLFVVIFLALKGIPPPPLAAFQSAPGYGYLGGLIVATYVISITYLAPRIGVGNAICFIVTGQILSAVIIDHFGLFGALVHDLSWRRVAGILLMIAGLFLARRV
ncbi:MAG: DMT family transporter [Gammaproteobacteria bacterium]|nr:DMT family transporter [Gammaproteobacteria bacterium]